MKEINAPGHIVFGFDHINHHDWWMELPNGKIHSFDCPMSQVAPTEYRRTEIRDKCKCEEPPMLVKLEFFYRRLNGI